MYPTSGPWKVRAVGLLNDKDAAAKPDCHHGTVMIWVTQPPLEPGCAEADLLGNSPRPMPHRRGDLQFDAAEW